MGNFLKNSLPNKIFYNSSLTLKKAIRNLNNNIKNDKQKKVILFSPCAASFDQFKNFEERGKFFNKSIQGDSRIVEIYKQFGVETNFHNNKIHLKKNNIDLPDSISINLRDNPDLAQTIIVTCLGLGVDCKLEGLQTLKVKETDRLLALKREIEKFEVDTIAVSDQSITLKNNSKLKSGVTINTYDDHRMAMSFAPLSIINPIVINNPEVVSKSYLNFWNDLESIGFNISQK